MTLLDTMARAYLTALAPGGFADLDSAVRSRLPALRAALAAAEAAGWVMVPQEPTDEMIGAGLMAAPFVSPAYRAMLATRPSIE